jgi:predicted nucleic acid-binding protein
LKSKVISDSTPLIALSKVKRVNVLERIFGNIYIPEAVWDEVVEEGKGLSGSEIKNLDWIKVEKVKERNVLRALSDQFGKGEREVIGLAIESVNPIVLIDEKAAKRKLNSLEITVIGTLGILLTAKKLKLIKSVKEPMDKLSKSGFYIDNDLYNSVLELAEE